MWVAYVARAQRAPAGPGRKGAFSFEEATRPGLLLRGGCMWGADACSRRTSPRTHV